MKLNKKPSKLEVDDQIVKIFLSADEELRKLFFEAIETKNIGKADFVSSRLQAVKSYLSTEFSKYNRYKTLHEYLQGMGFYNKQKDILDILGGLKIDTVQESLDGLGVAFGVTHKDAVINLIQQVDDTVGSAILGIDKQMRRQLGEFVRVSIQQGLAKSIVLGKSLQGQKNDIMETIASKGVAMFTDRSGRKRSLANYADMITRTETARAFNTGTINRGVELGITKYQVYERADCCPICIPHRGQVYDVNDPGVQLPPYHPRCNGFVNPIF